MKFVDKRHKISKTFQDALRCSFRRAFRGFTGILACSLLMKASSCLTGKYLGFALVKPKTCIGNFMLNHLLRSTELENHKSNRIIS
jgi:hypothetical protein